MYFHTVPQTISTISVTLICAYAFLRGGGPERWGAAITFISWMVTPLVEDLTKLNQAQFGISIVDGLYTIGLFVLALTSKRYWPLVAVAFYILEMLMHVDMLIDHKVRARSYFVGLEIWSYLALIVLAVGTWLEAPRPVKAKASSPTS